MNSKRAKKLRKAARQMTVGWPTVQYGRNPNTGNRILAGISTRKTYHTLKEVDKL